MTTANKKQKIPTVTSTPALAPTAEETAAKARALFEKWTESVVFGAENKLQSFADTLIKDALYAFEWSQSSFEAAGELAVAREVQQLLQSGEVGLAQIASYCAERAMSGARNPKHSSSAVSNYASQCKTVAYARFAENAEKFGALQ